jgi:hypothetical protein
MSWRRPRAFALRLHVSAAPPRAGLTQALGPMANDLYISDQWQDYRRRARLFFWLLAGFIPIVGLVVVSLNRHATEAIAVIIATVWLFALCVAILRLQFFPCPNCNKPFAFKHLNRLPFSVDACVHCGLAKWEH